jgi:hypothetical protein
MSATKRKALDLNSQDRRILFRGLRFRLPGARELCALVDLNELKR